MDGNLNDKRIGWVGAGRMGAALATRLLDAGCDVAVYNRTRAKCEPLAELGATIVDQPAELGDRDIVFTILAGSADFQQVVAGPEGLAFYAVRPVHADGSYYMPGAIEKMRRHAGRARVVHIAADYLLASQKAPMLAEAEALYPQK